MPITKAEALQIIDAAWTAYDKDGSGFLEKPEAHRLFKDLFNSEGVNLNDEQLDVIVGTIDNNGDNKISKEEMVQLLMENL